ncbi:DUF4294 domain-containing protein [Nemorincola caseinilytica]|uniref:DUF4294 domain-containing protein n=1 Tax=Nemorincola caseinilytica TaxID=2054315 RepID=UPI0031E8D709
MSPLLRHIICLTLLLLPAGVFAQLSGNDTIRLGAIEEKGGIYPLIFLDEVETRTTYLSEEDRVRRNRLRRDIYITYPYAIAAAAILKDVNQNLERMDSRKDRKRYLKQIDHKLDVTFKDPLKNLSVDQGHVLIKLINRQTGQNCYSIIRELKNGFSAMIWQSVGLVFNNNLRREYDPTGNDSEMEAMVQVLEASSNYRYQLYMQQEIMKKIPPTVSK